MAEVEQVADKVAELTVNNNNEDEKGLDDSQKAAEEEEVDVGASLEFGKKKKKKKHQKKKKKKSKTRTDEEFGPEGGASGEQGKSSGGLPWDGSDRDYKYEELLDRVFGILKENNPELTGERRRTTLKPPQVAREGTKKTVFSNFMDLARSMNRNPEHLQAYLLAELGTSGSLDGQQRLILKGRFLPKAFEGCLRRYMNEYVLCNRFGGGNDSNDSPPAAPSEPGPQEGSKPTIIPIEYEYDVQPVGDSPPFTPIDDSIAAPQPPEPILIPVSPALPPPPSPSPPFPPPSPSVLSPPPSPETEEPPPLPDTNDIVEPIGIAAPPANTIFVPDAGDVQGSSENSTGGSGTSRTTAIIIAVACSVGGILVLSSLVIFCWYCRSRRRGVADSGSDVEAGRRSRMQWSRG
eukprot:jgi/Picre1/32503/NNA_007849.t1